MNPTTRRTFLVAFGALVPIAGLAEWLRRRFPQKPFSGSGEIPASWKSGSISAPAQPIEPFPYLDYYEPYPSGQPSFEKDLIEPSFLHPNGIWVVLPEASGGFEVWDWRQGIPVLSLGGVHGGEDLQYPCGEDTLIPGCFSPDGKTWIHGREWHGGDDGQALMGTGMDGSGTWDYGLPAEVQIDPKRPVIHVTEGRSYAVEGGSDNKGIYEIDALGGDLKRVHELPSPFHTKAFSAPASISPDGRWILAWHEHPAKKPGGGWGWWAVWSLADSRCRAYETGSYDIHPVRGFSLDGATAFIPGQGAWNWSGQDTHSEIAPYPWSAGGIGPSLIKIDREQTELARKGEGILEVRSTKNQNLIRRLVAFPPNNALIAFGPKPHLLLASPPSGKPWVWNRRAPVRAISAQLENGSLMRPGFSALDYGAARSLAWDSGGNQIAVGSDLGAIGLFNAAGFRVPDGTKGDETSLGKPLRILRGLDVAIRGVAFIPEGIVALNQNGTVAVWGANGDEPKRTWQAHSSRSNSLQVSPDSRMVATGSLDGAALWSVADGQLIRRLGVSHSGVSCLHFDPHGQRLAVTYLDGWMALFDVASGKVLWEVQAHTDVAAAVAFHPSGNWLVSLGWDTKMRKWDAKAGSAGAIFEAPKASGSLAWSRDGKWLAIGGSHPEIRDESLGQVGGSLDFLWDAECT